MEKRMSELQYFYNFLNYIISNIIRGREKYTKGERIYTIRGEIYTSGCNL